VERENAFFQSSPVDEYHMPQMNTENVFFGVAQQIKRIKLFENPLQLVIWQQK
jgi:hypothetical protein